MSGGHQNRLIYKLAVICIIHIALRRLFQILRFPFMNKMILVKPFKSLLKLPQCTFHNSTTIFFILLPVNICQRELLNSGMFLKQPEKIAGLHGSMLPGIADKQYPVIVCTGNLYYFHTFTQGIQSRFINNHETTGRRLFRTQQKACNRLRLLKPLLFQHICCRICRRNHINTFHSARTQSFTKFLQRGSLTGTGHTAEQIKTILRIQHSMNQLRLFDS